MEDRNSFVERLLEKGLDRLGEYEPSPGFETRVLARLRSGQARTPRVAGSWKFGVSLAAAALIGVSALLYISHPGAHRLVPAAESVTAPASSRHRRGTADLGHFVQEQRPMVNRRAVEHGDLVTSSNPQDHPNPRHDKREVAARREAVIEPRLPVFPSPAPLSEEEKLLLRYARSAPPGVVTFAHDIEPTARLQIKPLEFPPLKQLSPETRGNE